MDWLIPPGQFAEHLLVAGVSLGVSALAVVIHYEGLHVLARRYIAQPPCHSPRAILKIMFSLIGLHLVEILCFALAFWGLIRVPGTGFIQGGKGVETLFDALYMSATNYTTLGFGDLAPVGAIRMVSGLEGLIGLLLITWSASFTFLEMSRQWNPHQRD